MKTCSKCNIEKAKTEFYKMTALRPVDDGYDYYCKVCRTASSKKTAKTNKVRCTLDGCDSPNYARNICRMHYDKLRRREKRAKKNG